MSKSYVLRCKGCKAPLFSTKGFPNCINSQCVYSGIAGKLTATEVNAAHTLGLSKDPNNNPDEYSLFENYVLSQPTEDREALVSSAKDAGVPAHLLSKPSNLKAKSCHKTKEGAGEYTVIDNIGDKYDFSSEDRERLKVFVGEVTCGGTPYKEGPVFDWGSSKKEEQRRMNHEKWEQRKHFEGRIKEVRDKREGLSLDEQSLCKELRIIIASEPINFWELCAKKDAADRDALEGERTELKARLQEITEILD